MKALVRTHGPLRIAKLAWNLPQMSRLMWRLMNDRRVSGGAKAILLGGVAYMLFPLDFLADWMPFLGQMDDLAILLLACRTFLNLCPGEVVQEHAAQVAPRMQMP